MHFEQKIKQALFNINHENFEQYSLEVFNYQAINNQVYRQYLDYLGIKPENINKATEIPFLPIALFKTHEVKTGNTPTTYTFESSGTTGQDTSKHHITDIDFYKTMSEEIFELFFGPAEEYIFLCLMPSYLERNNSSLIYMLSHFIEKSKSALSGFYLNDFQALTDKLQQLRNQNKKVQLWGVTYALLELAENHPCDLSFAEIIETGGMKGRRAEKTREEVHEQLKKAFNLNHIYTEYGMTELLSQAYALYQGNFKTPPWMRLMLRDVNDPFDKGTHIKGGGVNIIDLANVHSCAFIETMDLGRQTSSGDIQIIGRFDHSETRGCNLLVV